MRVWQTTTGEVSEGKFLVVRRDGSVPRWPHFVMGARDPAVPHALRAYADRAAELGMEAEYVESVRGLAALFEAYRAEHGDGDPEKGPHRKDDPDVVRVMRGGDGYLQARHEGRQLQHDTGPEGGRPCSRCGMRYSGATAYIPCFESGDTLQMWQARHQDSLDACPPGTINNILRSKKP